MRPIPAGVPKEHRRFYAVTRIAFPIPLAVHLAFLGIFLLIGEMWLAAFNVLSLAVWGSAVFFHSRGHYRTLGGPALAEIFAHSVLCVLFLGTASGFHFYLLTNIALPFLVPFYSPRVKVGLAGASTIAFAALLLWGFWVPPLSEHPSWLLSLFLAGNAIGIAVVIGAIIAGYENTVADAEARLEAAYARTDELLHNMLPAGVVSRLKESSDTVADGHTQVSILFADIVGFTELSSSLSPERLVALLNRIFSAFDALVDRHGLEKIKTIGDAYMVVAGAPEPRADHAEALADLAVALRSRCRELGEEEGLSLELRQGMNSGEVVAGVIGTSKLAWDLWGDTVNTAARMEAFGLPGEIQVTLVTRNLLAHRFQFQARPPIEIKGKGTMETFLLDVPPDDEEALPEEETDSGVPLRS